MGANNSASEYSHSENHDPDSNSKLNSNPKRLNQSPSNPENSSQSQNHSATSHSLSKPLRFSKQQQSQNWEQVARPNEYYRKEYGKFRVYQNRQTKQECQMYSATLNSKAEYDEFKQHFDWRSKCPEYLVQARTYEQEPSKQLCSSQYKVQQYTERIPLRLCDLTDIPFPQNLTYLVSVLKGFKYIATFPHEISSFRVLDSMVCLNTKGQVKVWMNPNLSKYQSLPSPHKQYHTQQDLIENIIDMVEANTDQMGNPYSFRQFLRNRRVLVSGSFNLMIGQVYAFAEQLRVQIPDRSYSVRDVLQRNSLRREMAAGKLSNPNKQQQQIQRRDSSYQQQQAKFSADSPSFMNINVLNDVQNQERHQQQPYLQKNQYQLQQHQQQQQKQQYQSFPQQQQHINNHFSFIQQGQQGRPQGYVGNSLDHQSSRSPLHMPRQLPTDRGFSASHHSQHNQLNQHYQFNQHNQHSQQSPAHHPTMNKVSASNNFPNIHSPLPSSQHPPFPSSAPHQQNPFSNIGPTNQVPIRRIIIDRPQQHSQHQHSPHQHLPSPSPSKVNFQVQSNSHQLNSTSETKKTIRPLPQLAESTDLVVHQKQQSHTPISKLQTLQKKKSSFKSGFQVRNHSNKADTDRTAQNTNATRSIVIEKASSTQNMRFFSRKDQTEQMDPQIAKDLANFMLRTKLQSTN